MSHVIAFANPASRTGKTTSASRLCLELAGRGVTVLAIDMDPRAELSRAFGIDVGALGQSMHDVLCAGADPRALLHDTDFGVDLLPAAPELSLAEGLLVARAGRESMLRTAIAGLRGEYETVVIDCPSSLGLLTLNAIAAADELVIPGPGRATRAGAALLRAADEIRQFVNPGLVIT